MLGKLRVLEKRHLVRDRTRKTLASDGAEIRYHPDWIATTDAHLIKTAIGRVVLACALKHHKGCYGTDFRPGFARLAELNVRPAVCLYFTDMDCSDYPDTRPDFPVLWVNYGPPPTDENREPWGERIDIAA